jgi:hypothetical protein
LGGDIQDGGEQENIEGFCVLQQLFGKRASNGQAILGFVEEVVRASLGDLLPTLPSTLYGGGIFFLWQNSEGH